MLACWLVRLAAAAAGAGELVMMAGSPHEADDQIGDYILVERIASLPRTHALTASSHFGDELVALESFGLLPEPNLPGPLELVPFDSKSWMRHVMSWSARLLGYAEPAQPDVLSAPPYYHLRKQVGKGGHGEVWRGVSSRAKRGVYAFVLKRISMDAEHEPSFRSGLREIHFGQKLQGVPHVSRFMEWFSADADGVLGETLSVEEPGVEAEGEGSAAKKSLWLVFADEGTSLHDLIYELRDIEPMCSGKGGCAGGRTGDAQASAAESAVAMRGERRSPPGPSEAAGGGEPAHGEDLRLPPPSQPRRHVPAALGAQPGARAASADAAAGLLAAAGASAPAPMAGGTARAAGENAVERAGRGGGGAHARGGAGRREHRARHEPPQPPPQPLKVLAPSALWRQLRTHERGLQVLRETLRQLFEAVADLHARRIVHRDLKPGNVIVRYDHPAADDADDADDAGNGSQSAAGAARGGRDGGGPDGDQSAHPWSARAPHITVRLIDFGSALDLDSLNNATLYPPDADPIQGETAAYQPPEVALHDGAPMRVRGAAYDLWSLGVLLLELLVGSADIFKPDKRTRAIIGLTLGNEPASVQRKAALAHAWERFGIFHQPAERSARPHGDAVGAEPDSEGTRQEARAAFFSAVKQLNPLPSFALPEAGIDLAWQLLQWDPSDRLSAAAALRHPFFTAAASSAEIVAYVR